MIVVHAVLRSRPERRTETVAALIAMQHAVRSADEGCMYYAFVADLQDDCLFTCVEEWTDMKALQSHLASPHMRALDQLLSETAEGPAEIRIFEAVNTEIPEVPA
ncbi:putative quinol monooxygenase [Actinopolymorpha pittospori]|uniref:Quinol monooxygenase YgiN n=1 Tax=Actinopolymorpha pittospori TaxID=648752 RepID=A0A927N7N8_9ACTN|nr:putative quinol monooxygenase [Actinopolymorpha pittospori]MBE1612518.1 quinol monooxygenase YgiN [Actinopolymorpha pittospori]